MMEAQPGKEFSLDSSQPLVRRLLSSLFLRSSTSLGIPAGEGFSSIELVGQANLMMNTLWQGRRPKLWRSWMITNDSSIWKLRVRWTWSYEIWSWFLVCWLSHAYLAFIQANPPETMQTDISLSQFLAIQEKGVSAWEFEPELEIANCFVEARTEIEFYDSECSVQSNLPIPKQNEVYYWEAKIYDKPESTSISIGLTTKPYPLFRLPGNGRPSVRYL